MIQVYLEAYQTYTMDVSAKKSLVLKDHLKLFEYYYYCVTVKN